jgi:thioredoxin-like negative regulator of GroEL
VNVYPSAVEAIVRELGGMEFRMVRMRVEAMEELTVEVEGEPALADLLAAVRNGQGEERDRARELMLDVFRLLGDDHPLTARYRRDLTRALF